MLCFRRTAQDRRGACIITAVGLAGLWRGYRKASIAILLLLGAPELRFAFVNPILLLRFVGSLLNAFDVAWLLQARLD